VIEKARLTLNELGYIIELDGCTLSIPKSDLHLVHLSDDMKIDGRKVLFYHGMRAIVSNSYANELIGIGVCLK